MSLSSYDLISSIASVAARLTGRRQARLRVWRAAARRVGLSGVQESAELLFFKPSLAGRWGPLSVRLEKHQEGGQEAVGTRISVDGLGHGVDGLSIRAEGLGTAVFRRLLGAKIELGDPVFDREVCVQGWAPLVFALLDAETRRGVAGLVRGAVEVRGRGAVKVKASLADGSLAVWVPDGGLAEGALAEVLGGALESVLDLGRRLVAPRDLPGRIAENLGREPLAGVRLQGLLALVHGFPQHPASRAALLAACRDVSPELRFRAAAALGAEGHGTLVALATGEAADDSLSSRAVLALGDALSLGQAETALRRALEGRRSRTAHACVEYLGRRGDAGSEGAILQALECADPQIALAAVRALGRVGTAAAVPSLRDLATSWLSGLSGAARQAITEIQARLHGAAPGQLTIADGEAGALSLATEPGRLSLAQEEGGPSREQEPAMR